jgi:hypothetical protein
VKASKAVLIDRKDRVAAIETMTTVSEQLKKEKLGYDTLFEKCEI